MVYLAESRFPTAISAGSKEVCRAKVSLHVKSDNTVQLIKEDIKFDTGGSVSLAHPKYLMNVMSCKEHGIPNIKLSGIGGTTPILNKAGELHVRKDDGNVMKIKMYVFEAHVGNTM